MIAPQDPAELYDEGYFTQKQRPYRNPDGSAQLYTGPARDWHGFDLAAAELLNILPERPATALDVGCGPGGWMRAMLQAGVDIRGCDFSEYALNNPVPQIADRIARCDLMHDPLPGDGYDLVTCLDLLEHIYLGQVPTVLDKMVKAARRYLFFVVCSALPHEVWCAVPGEEVPMEREWLAVAGHFTCQTHAWWCDQVMHAGATVRRDLMAEFEWWRKGSREMSGVMSWSDRNIIIAEVDHG